MRPIDGDELFEVITEEIESVYKQKPTDALINYGLKIALRDIECQPTIKISPVKHGRWIHDVHTQWKCSNCGNFLDFDGLNCGRGSAFYCPNCGADMRGDKK